MKKTVKIEGMMCNNCRKHAEEALKNLGLNVTVSLEDKAAYIEDCTVEDEKIIAAIDECGYEVVEIL